MINMDYKYYRSCLFEYHSRYLQTYKDYYGNVFTREFAHPYRRFCSSASQLCKQILYYNGTQQEPAYITVHSFKEFIHDKRKTPIYGTAIIERIFFDFDSPDISKAFDDVIKLYEYFDKKPTIFFSGKKGFHLFVFLDSIISYETLRHIVENVNKISLKTWNSPENNTCGLSQTLDLARVSRIPYTLHQETNMQMIPIDTSSTIENIVESASEFQIPVIIIKNPVNIDKWLQ